MGWNRIMIEVILRDCDLVVNNQTSTDTHTRVPKQKRFTKRKAEEARCVATCKTRKVGAAVGWKRTVIYTRPQVAKVLL